MISISHGQHTIELFGSIKELPITRYKALQLLLLQDSGIGADMGAIDAKLEKILMFANAGKTNETREEVLNLRYTFHSMLKGLDYKTRAFGCLVNKINGVQQADITDEGLKNTVKVIEDMGVTSEELNEWWEDLKKNLIPN
jgi:hypothetical protein